MWYCLNKMIVFLPSIARVMGVNHRSCNQTMRDIIEAHEIERLGSKCVSKASITLSEKEISFLSNTEGTSGVTK